MYETKYPQEQIDQIMASLKKTNQAIYSTDAFTSYYFIVREIEKRESQFDQFVLVPGEVDNQLLEELKVKGKELGYKFVTILRDKDLKESVAHGKIVYLYYFSKSRYSTGIPDELIKEEHQSEIFRSSPIIPDWLKVGDGNLFPLFYNRGTAILAI